MSQRACCGVGGLYPAANANMSMKLGGVEHIGQYVVAMWLPKNCWILSQMSQTKGTGKA